MSDAPEVKTLTPRMRVRALRQGYIYDKLRYPATGDKAANEFDLIPYTITNARTGEIRTVTCEEQFSHEWMERIDGGKPPNTRKIMPEDVAPPPILPSAPDLPRTATDRNEIPLPAPLPVQVMPGSTAAPKEDIPGQPVEVPTGNQQVI